MAMPMDLVLVRHGQSEGNAANKLSRRGDNRAFTEEYRKRHSSQWRLTDAGIRQAQAAGAWIREHIGGVFDRYYTSEYLRAMETAALLRLPEATWFADFYLREREWGELDVMPDNERLERYGESLQRRTQDTFYWTPPGGESIAALCLRIDRVLDTLHRECDGKRVIIVCHGEVTWGFRIRLERIPQRRYRELDFSSNPHERVHNGQVIHYTRRSPVGGQVVPYFSWMRSVCPWDMSKSCNEWETIIRPRYGNDDLLAIVREVQRLVNDPEGWTPE